MRMMGLRLMLLFMLFIMLLLPGGGRCNPLPRMLNILIRLVMKVGKLLFLGFFIPLYAHDGTPFIIIIIFAGAGRSLPSRGVKQLPEKKKIGGKPFT
jgi:hypothetical protein